MEVVLIQEPRWAAREKFLEYRDAVAAGQSNESDEVVMATYRELAKGRTVLDLHQTLRNAGTDSWGRPHLAIARADKRKVQFGYRYDTSRPVFYDSVGDGPSWSRRARKAMNSFTLPYDTFQRVNGFRDCVALVPSIPPDLRPGKTQRRKYAILWEAEWEGPPEDPMLLAPIKGKFYAVVATWDLTPLERAALTS